MTQEQLIEQIVRQVYSQMQIGQLTDEQFSEIIDITSKEAKSRILLDAPMDREAIKQMKTKTVARIGVGRAGPRLKTTTLLTLRADHAAAQDSVFTDTDANLIERMGLLAVQTLCESRDQHITRPDLGRQFSKETIDLIKSHCKPRPQVQVYISDGLSSKAIEANVENFMPALTNGLAQYGIEIGTPFFVKYGRVASMEPIAEALGSQVTCVLIGERPGLATSESMSAYLAYNATVGMPESRRNVVSNIHQDGISATEAGAYLADVMKKMLDTKTSGVELKL